MSDMIETISSQYLLSIPFPPTFSRVILEHFSNLNNNRFHIEEELSEQTHEVCSTSQTSRQQANMANDKNAVSDGNGAEDNNKERGMAMTNRLTDTEGKGEEKKSN